MLCRATFTVFPWFFPSLSPAMRILVRILYTKTKVWSILLSMHAKFLAISKSTVSFIFSPYKFINLSLCYAFVERHAEECFKITVNTVSSEWSKFALMRDNWVVKIIKLQNSLSQTKVECSLSNKIVLWGISWIIYSAKK